MTTPTVGIDRHGRGWVYLAIATDPILSGWEVRRPMGHRGDPRHHRRALHGRRRDHPTASSSPEPTATPTPVAGQITLASTTTIEVVPPRHPGHRPQGGAGGDHQVSTSRKAPAVMAGLVRGGYPRDPHVRYVIVRPGASWAALAATMRHHLAGSGSLSGRPPSPRRCGRRSPWGLARP